MSATASKQQRCRMIENVVNSEIATAWQFHQAGRFADAARCYHSVLARQPDHAEALHLFGVLHHQNGYFARAVELIGRAVALQPETAALPRQPGRGSSCARPAPAGHRLLPDRPAAASRTTPRRPTTSAWPCTRWAGMTRPWPSSEPRSSCGPISPWPRTTSARPSASWASWRGPPGVSRGGRSRSQAGRGAQQPRPMLVDQGEAEEGLTHCPEPCAATRLAGGPQQPRQRLPCNRAFERARAAYEEALRVAGQRSQPPAELAQVHANRGLAMFLEGDHAGAFACFALIRHTFFICRLMRFEIGANSCAKASLTIHLLRVINISIRVANTRV